MRSRIRTSERSAHGLKQVVAVPRVPAADLALNPEPLSADDDDQQKALLDLVVALLKRLGQRGCAVGEELGEYRLSRFDTETDPDYPANDAQADTMFNSFLQRYPSADHRRYDCARANTANAPDHPHGPA